AEKGPYTRYLKKDALQGKRFGVPDFMMEGTLALNPPPSDRPNHGAVSAETRAAFMKAVEQLRAAGATVVMDKSILPEHFAELIAKINVRPYRAEGMENFLRDFGPETYHSVAEYEQATGETIPAHVLGGEGSNAVPQRDLMTDPSRESTFFGPQKAALAEYNATMTRLKLDGFVYPSLQIPTYDEMLPGASSAGPYSETGWVNRLGVPAVSVPGGFYADGLPFGLEISGPRWTDGQLLGFAYAYEQATHNRRLPKLQEPHRQGK
ncbi:MAG: amidase family protein, partial [Edaphobacter sp.]